MLTPAHVKGKHVKVLNWNHITGATKISQTFDIGRVADLQHRKIIAKLKGKISPNKFITSEIAEDAPSTEEQVANNS